MKRFVHILTACTLLVMLTMVQGAYAQEEVPTVVIGDGAPIPYLDTAESRLVKDAETIRGITGAFPDGTSFEQPDTMVYSHSDPGIWNYELQNIVLTDDVLGLFFKQTYSIPIPYQGDNAFTYGRRKPAHAQ